MAQYSSVKSGSLVSVTNGSSIVVGTGSDWLGKISVGDGFTVAGTSTIYDVASVDSNTQITLTTNYSGPSATDVHYTIHRDFTTPDNIPELSNGDIETGTIMKRLARVVQGRFNALSGLTYTGQWTDGTLYPIGSIVIYDDGTTTAAYVANVEHTAATANQPPDAVWDVIFTDINTVAFTSLSWIGDWTASTEYFEQNVVRYNDNIYVATANFTSGTSFNPANWDILIDVQTLSSLVTDAEAARDKAQLWAEESEDVEVETGQYSAKHYSIKSSDSAAAAATSESNASTSESNAATSESNALSSANTSEDWATLLNSTVDGTEYSSKHYSQEASTSASNASTSESNALSSANTSEDWAILIGSTVDGTEYSSKHYSQEASTSASNASTSESNAATSESNAATSESNALASENKAEQWADAPLGTEVEPGKYSARHWAEQLGAVSNSAYNWQGDWAAGTYNAGDAVFHVPTASSYITLVTTTDEPNLSGTSDWQLLARAAQFEDAAFLSLNDTPSDYTGSAGLFVQVNGTEDGLVFSSASTYSGWTLFVDGASQGNIASGEAVDFVGGTNTTLSYNATGNVITIDSLDTTYSAGTGITLTGGTFSLTDETYTTTEKNKLAGVETSADNYTSWTISDGTATETIGSGDILVVTGSGATSTSYNATNNTLTISSTDTDTTYTAGTGLTLTGTSFALADESYTTAEKNKLAGIESGATADQTASEIKTAYESNADTNAYTDAEKTTVANLSTVATSGSYDDLINKPDLSVLDDVLSYASQAGFPATGETGKVYVAEDTGYIYRWDGSAYVQLTDQTAIWGQITGALSSQTDLQNALDTKLEDAPSDGEQYARQDGVWSVVDSGISNLGTLTSSMSIGQAETITLSSAIDTPILSATKEVVSTGVINSDWNVTGTNFEAEDFSPDTTITPSATSGTITLTLGAGAFTADHVGLSAEFNGGRAILTATDGTAEVQQNFNSTQTVASADWVLRGIAYSGSDISVVTKTLPGIKEYQFNAGQTLYFDAAVLNNGNFVVAYYDGSTGCYLKVYDANGSVVTSATQFTSNSSGFINVDVLSNGNIVVAYQDDGNLDYGTYQIYDVNLNQVLAATVFMSSAVSNIDIAVLNNDNLFFVFRDTDNSSYGKVTIFNPSGSQVLAPATFNTASTYETTASVFGTGEVMVSYRDGGASNAGKFAIYSEAGSQTVAPTTFSTGSVSVPANGSLSNGNVVIAFGDSGGTGNGAYIIYNASGTEVVAQTESIVASTFATSVSSLSDGNFMIAIEDQSVTPRVGRYVIHSTSGTEVVGSTVFRDEAVPGAVVGLPNGVNGIVYREGATPFYGYFTLLESDFEVVATNQHLPAITNDAKQINTEFWADINSFSVTDAPNGQSVHYAISDDARESFFVVSSAAGARDIARNNAGTWEYNSSTVYANTTWTAASRNSVYGALEDAMPVTVNQMDSAQLAAAGDADFPATTDTLDLAVILYTADASNNPSFTSATINYDANATYEVAIPGTDYEWEHPDSTTVRFTALSAENFKVRVI